MDLYVEKTERRGASLVIPKETARGMNLVIERLHEQFGVEYAWIYDENGNPTGVVMSADTFRQLRRDAGEPLG